MRMRHKKNLDKRIQDSSSLILQLKELPKDRREAKLIKEYIDTESVFGRKAPLHLEIGCGKGTFVVEMAKRHPDIDYLAIEKLSNVLVVATELAVKEGVTNVRFALCSAELLASYLMPNSVEKIYLNFSTPLPNLGYIRQRLTSPVLLGVYEQFLIDKGTIIQKTDNVPFFDYSLESFRENGFGLNNVTYDLHGEGGVTDDVMTEYESKFVSQGMPICRVEAYRL